MDYYDNNLSYADQYMFAIEDQKKIRKHSMAVGFGLLVFIAATNLFALVLRMTGIYDIAVKSEVVMQSLEVIHSIVGIFIPFLIIYFATRKRNNNVTLGFDSPYSKGLFILSIPAGLMLCMFGDTVSSYIVSFFKIFGVNMNSADNSFPKSLPALLIYFLAAVIVAPVVEEFSLRGVTLQPLRKYGDKYAIVMTALVFGLMHQNIIQGIFAFMAGIVIGYFAIATGTCWSAVLIHLCNNFYSVCLSYVTNSFSDDVSTRFYVVTNGAIYVIGIICLVLFLINRNRIKLKNNTNLFLGTGKKCKAFLTTPPMIIAIIFMLINTLSYVSFGG